MTLCWEAEFGLPCPIARSDSTGRSNAFSREISQTGPRMAPSPVVRSGMGGRIRPLNRKSFEFGLSTQSPLISDWLRRSHEKMWEAECLGGRIRPLKCLGGRILTPWLAQDTSASHGLPEIPENLTFDSNSTSDSSEWIRCAKNRYAWDHAVPMASICI